MADPTDLIKNFAIDTWYKVFVLVGIGIFFVSLVLDIKVITNNQGLLLGGGLVILGTGIWVGTRRVMEFLNEITYYHKVIWKPVPIGIFLDIIGLFLIYLLINSILGNPYWHP